MLIFSELNKKMKNTKGIRGAEITRGSILFKNTLWNSLGLILPMIVGFLTIPLLIHGLGTERFGVLTIIWMIIGYSSILDFGLGRALTKLVAEKLGKELYDEIPALIRTSLLLLVGLSFVSAAAVFFLSDSIVLKWLNINPSLQPETLNAFRIMAFSIPFVLISTGFRAVLEAHQKFAVVNIIRIPLALITFLGPLLILPFSGALDKIVIVLLLARIIGTGAFFYFLIDTAPEIKSGTQYDTKQIKGLLGYGSWMTITNLVAPLIIYLDRFLIGSVLTMNAVALYVAPFEVVTRLSTLAMPFVGVLFPAFSTLLSSDKKKAAYFYSRGTYLVFLLMFPLTLSIVTIADGGAQLWLGREFGQTSAVVLQCLALGVLINSVGQVPFVLLQGAGRPDIPAKLYLFELPVYVGAILCSLHYFGIVGVAVVWSLRTAVDTFVFLIAAAKLMPETKADNIKIFFKLLVAASVLIVFILIESFSLRLAGLFVVLPAFLAAEWKYGLNAEDKANITLLMRLRKRFV